MERILTPREEEVMQILWRLKKAFVKEILAEMQDPKPPYNTISSIVRKLAKEGIVGYYEYGKTHQYFPVLKQKTYKKKTFRRLLKNYFSNSPEVLLSHFIKEENVDIDELDELLHKMKQEKP